MDSQKQLIERQLDTCSAIFNSRYALECALEWYEKRTGDIFTRTPDVEYNDLEGIDMSQIMSGEEF